MIPSSKPFQGDGSSPRVDRRGIVPSRVIFVKPSERMRELIASTPSRSIQAFVAVLSDGPIMSVARSFHVGFRPASSIRSVPEPSALFASVRSQRADRSTVPSRTRAIASVRTAILMTEADSNSASPLCS